MEKRRQKLITNMNICDSFKSIFPISSTATGLYDSFKSKFCDSSIF